MKSRIDHRSDNGRFVIDRHYLRSEAREAIKTFVAPLTGVYEAATGSERQFIRRSSTGQFEGKKAKR